ncbi:coiled-coil domain-containing protein 170 [Colossoma macropomum]|uniref:coiled-coil domain-containing protein 170 n=1 Tax=Colossoma macropomum TaxID=42526 RepID=UPI0018654211|nr:coiled-coil domain-containing protein 170 [Colossoma macropomum]XP_036449855.1 coiled-coil domain-containing protein 170 [Colossoma macropomum]
MDDSVMQQHLVHYKQATESAREELAALQTKHQSLHSQLLDARSKISSQEALVQDLREVIDKHKETEARQASLISSLRERIHNTEQEMGSISSSKSIMDMKLQALNKENEEMRERAQQMEIKSKNCLSNWNKTKQEAGDLQRRHEEFISRLSSKLSTDLAESDEPMEMIISLVGQCCKERDRQRTQISALEENVKSHEVECKASRETVRRLVADLDHEQKLSAGRASDLNSVRQELDCVLLKKQNLERENQSLKSKLRERELALTAAKEDSDSSEKRSEDLECRLHRSQNEAQASHSRMEAFLKGVEVLLGDLPESALPKEERVLDKLREVCRREKSSNVSVRELEVRLAEVSQELARQTELLRAAEQREQQIQCRAYKLESELLTAGVSKDGLSHEKQQYLQFLEKLSEKMKIEHIATDLGFDMRLEAILTRAEQLTRQEGTALVETKTLTYSLQKKVKEQKERLESKELHMELLRRKVAQLDEEKRSRSALSVERDDATLANKKLQKKVERLQAELSVVRFSNTELKAQLADTNELKIRVMEQKQAIQEQIKSLGKLEKNKAKVEKRLTTVKTELQNQEYRARDELLQAQMLLHSQASAMAELAHREKKLLDFCTVVSQMLGVDMPASLPSNEVIKRLEVLIHSCHHHFPLACHCATPHHPHLMASACSSLTAGSLGPEVQALPAPPITDTP